MTTVAELAVAPVQRVISTCTAYSADGAEFAELPLTGGSVTADARRARLRDATLQFAADAGLSHDDIYEILVTPGVQLQVARGFVLVGGSEVTTPVGRFVPSEPQQSRTQAGGELSVACSDASAKVSRARWTDSYQIASGTNLADALNALLADRWADVVTAIYSNAVTNTIGANVVFDYGESSDPWADAVSLAADHGWELYFDTSGVARVRSAPMLDPEAALFTFERGDAAIITDEARSSPLERTYNGVIVTGEGSELEVPVRGEAWDANPGSSTYYLGPFGKAPLFYSSPLITTEAQAEQAAQTRLAGVIGRVEQLSWSMVVHPGLQPLDVVLVEQADGSEVAYILDALTIPLGVGEAMSATAREITVTY